MSKVPIRDRSGHYDVGHSGHRPTVTRVDKLSGESGPAPRKWFHGNDFHAPGEVLTVVQIFNFGRWTGASAQSWCSVTPTSLDSSAELINRRGILVEQVE